MEQCADNYNALLDQAVSLEQQGRLLIIAPDDICGMDTLTRDKKAMDRFYKKGVQDGGAIFLYLKNDVINE